MTVRIAVTLVEMLVALLAAWVLPAIGMRMLMPALEASPKKVRNYRGVEVSSGLGIVWLLWAVIVLVVAMKAIFLGNAGLMAGSALLGSWSVWTIPSVLVLMAFAFGLVDDVFGGGEVKGFRGHLTALAAGRLTTGGMKLIGIGVSAAVAAFVGRLLWASDEGVFDPVWIASWVLATLTIALAANLVNLTDLRPGRALKTYSVLVALAMPGLAFGTVMRQGAFGRLDAWTSVAVSLVLAFGPVLAVWRYDLGERGMLGDAGANAMGALAGYLLVSGLPPWGLLVSTLVLFVLNLASERVSFSKAIEGNAALRWFDGLGRLRVDAGGVAVVDTRKDGGS